MTKKQNKTMSTKQNKTKQTNVFFMTEIRHLLNAQSRGWVQNDQRGIPQPFSHAKAI